jgi:hypothetical protein
MEISESRRNVWGLALALALCVPFVLRMFAAYAMPNAVWPDEIFQSMEQAHRLVFGEGIVPWEFREGARSWMLPGLLAGVMEVTSWFTASVVAYLMACAAALSVISLGPVWGAFRLAQSEGGLRGSMVAAAPVAMWFELVYFAPKALSEVVAGNVLVLGIVLGTLCVAHDRTASRGRVVGFAVALAVAAMLRIHLSIAAAAVFVAVLFKLPREARRVAVLAAGVVVIAFGALDWLTWDYPFQSYVENVRANIVEGVGARFGTASWTAYFEVYARLWGMWAVPLLVLAVIGARHAPLLAVAACVVIASHLPIAHKEYRFAYPAMVSIITLAALGSASIVNWVERRRGARFARLAAGGVIALWFAGAVVGANRFHGSKTQLAVVFADEQDHWARRRGGLLALRWIGEDPRACGVGLAIPWADTGGYTYLHRDLPLIELPTHQAMRDLMPHYNIVVTKRDPRDKIGPFVREWCEAEACVYVRPGPCEYRAGIDVNSDIARRGN